MGIDMKIQKEKQICSTNDLVTNIGRNGIIISTKEGHESYDVVFLIYSKFHHVCNSFGKKLHRNIL